MDLSPNTPLPMPFPRQGVLKISPLYADLRKTGPIASVITPYGDPAWVIFGYDEAKLAFSDSKRFGFFVHHDPKNAARLSQAALHSFPLGGFDFEAESGRMRRLLAPSFTPSRSTLAWEADGNGGGSFVRAAVLAGAEGSTAWVVGAGPATA